MQFKVKVDFSVSSRNKIKEDTDEHDDDDRVENVCTFRFNLKRF